MENKPKIVCISEEERLNPAKRGKVVKKKDRNQRIINCYKCDEPTLHRKLCNIAIFKCSVCGREVIP